MKRWDYLNSTNLQSSRTDIIKGHRNFTPPFKWAGSKNRMFKRYSASGFFTSNEPKIFVDMFAGTGTVGWWIAKNYPSTTVVLNETCDEIIQMYKMLQHKSYPAFCIEYDKHVNAYASYSTVDDRKKYYYALRNKYALNYHTMSSVEQAAALFFMLQTGFNGIWQTSDNFNNRYASPAGLMTWKPNGELFSRTRLKNYAEFIDRCVLMSGDFEQTACFMGSDTWFYADPPYRQSKAKYKSGGAFTDDDHTRLCEFLTDAHKYGDLCAMSNRENPSLNTDNILTGTVKIGHFASVFDDDWNVRYFDVKYTAGRHNKGLSGKEVLIKNY